MNEELNEAEETVEQEEQTSDEPVEQEKQDAGESSFKDRLYQKSEKRKVKGKVTFVNPAQIQEIIDEEVAKKEKEFRKDLAEKQKEFDDATERLKMLNKAALFENEELKTKMVDFKKLVADNEEMTEKLEQTKELFEIKKIYDRMLQLIGQCSSPEELKERVEELSRENTSLRERIAVLEKGLEFVGAVNPAPPEKSLELINEVDGKLGRMKDKLSEPLFKEIEREYSMDKQTFNDSVILGNELIKNMEDGEGTVHCIAEIVRNAEISRGLYEKFRLLSRLAGN